MAIRSLVLEKGKKVNLAPNSGGTGAGAIVLSMSGEEDRKTALRLHREERLYPSQSDMASQRAYLRLTTRNGDFTIALEGDPSAVQMVLDICKDCGWVKYLGHNADCVMLRRVKIAEA